MPSTGESRGLDYGSMSDSELLNLVRYPTRDEKAYTELVKRYQYRLEAIARRKYKPEIAAEVVQNAFIMLWAKPPLREDSKVGPWLARILVNKGTSEWRKRRRLDQLPESAESIGVSGTARTHLQFLIEREELHATLRILAKLKLPPHKKLAFLVARVLEVKPKEVVEHKSKHSLDRLCRDVSQELRLSVPSALMCLEALTPLKKQLDLRVDSFPRLLARYSSLAAFATNAIGETLLEHYYLTKEQETNISDWCNQVKNKLAENLTGEAFKG